MNHKHLPTHWNVVAQEHRQIQSPNVAVLPFVSFQSPEVLPTFLLLLCIAVIFYFLRTPIQPPDCSKIPIIPPGDPTIVRRPQQDRPSEETAPTLGISNIGNSCYMNSVLQVLASIPAFKAQFQRLRYSSTKNSEIPFLDAFDEVIKYLWVSAPRRYGPLTPYELRRLQLKPFNGRGQQDAEEFLEHVLNRIEEATTPTAWDRIIKFYMTSSVECTGCGSISESSQAYLVLRLNFPQEISTRLDLNAMLKYNFASEVLDGFECEQCKSRQMAYKRIDRSTCTPNVLFVTLARFSQERSKIFDAVEIPRLFVFPGTGKSYDLTSIVVHSGKTLQSGHYFAYIRASNKWYCVNDGVVCSGIDIEDEVASLCNGTADDQSWSSTPFIFAFQRRVM